MDANEYRERLLAVLSITEHATDPDEGEELYRQLDSRITSVEISDSDPAAIQAALSRVCVDEVLKLKIAAIQLSLDLLEIASTSSGRSRAEILGELAIRSAANPIALSGDGE